MREYVLLSILLLFVGLASARPAEKLSKDDFNVNSFLKKSRIQMIQKKSETKTQKPAILNHSLRIKSFSSSLVTVKEGQTVVLECEANGNPPPQIHWLKNSQRIVQANDQVYETLDQNSLLGLSLTRARLVINCADVDDTATYTCVAENAYSRVVAQSYINVMPVGKDEDKSYLKVPEQQACIERKSFGGSSLARIVMWTTTRLELIGSDVQLSCRTSGEGVQVSWLGPDENKLDFTNSKFSLLNNGDLFIRKISWDDMGDYTCIARNSFSEDKTTTFLYPTKPEDKK